LAKPCVRLAHRARDARQCVRRSTDQLRAITGAAHGDAHYPQVIQYVRGLKGRVACPDDPTIPILALKQAGRSSWAENDATYLPDMPDYLAKEIGNADYVILVQSSMAKYPLPKLLPEWNFETSEVGWRRHGRLHALAAAKTPLVDRAKIFFRFVKPLAVRSSVRSE